MSPALVDHQLAAVANLDHGIMECLGAFERRHRIAGAVEDQGGGHACLHLMRRRDILPMFTDLGVPVAFLGGVDHGEEQDKGIGLAGNGGVFAFLVHGVKKCSGGREMATRRAAADDDLVGIDAKLGCVGADVAQSNTVVCVLGL